MLTGSLQVKKGIYYAVINLYDEFGKRKPKWISTKLKEKGNKQHAKRKLQEIIAELENKNLNPKPSDDIFERYNNMLFCDYMKEWLESIKNSIAKTTYIGYSQVVNGKLYSYFKEKKIKLIELKPIHIMNFYEYLAEQGLGNNTIRHYNANISKALKRAVIKEIIPSSPIDKMESIKEEQYIGDFYSIEELENLMSILNGTFIELPILITSYYGLRRSEAVGIKWSAIDFKEKTITIKHTVGYGKVDGVTGFIFEDKTKNESSYRTLPLIPIVEELLLKHKDKQNKDKRFCGNTYDTKYKDYICRNDVGELIKPGYITQKFAEILQKNNLRHIRFHDLRHSCATLLKRNGVKLEDIQQWLGHSSYQTTLRYAHLDDEQKRESANVITVVFAKEQKKEQIILAE
ncbi:MAG: tyrosine-type recombinase/integrase [Clostridia bacterium]|nr:tyrosine-type recombinase/integrase [Clostridia bacterium]